MTRFGWYRVIKRLKIRPRGQSGDDTFIAVEANSFMSQEYDKCGEKDLMV